jgi:hypothetical protein
MGGGISPAVCRGLPRFDVVTRGGLGGGRCGGARTPRAKRNTQHATREWQISDFILQKCNRRRSEVIRGRCHTSYLKSATRNTQHGHRNRDEVVCDLIRPVRPKRGEIAA